MREGARNYAELRKTISREFSDRAFGCIALSTLKLGGWENGTVAFGRVLQVVECETLFARDIDLCPEMYRFAGSERKRLNDDVTDFTAESSDHGPGVKIRSGNIPVTTRQGP
jgi:hypothetical protein